jgi:ring-1,2-phenylacetyl-CoA epoxidase subunit PaaD
MLEREVWQRLAEVPDPEIPILNVVELGIIRYVRLTGDGGAEIGVSPTYTGCPATEVIHRSIRDHFRSSGLDVTVKSVLSPAWSSDWIADSARNKLRDYGIAPPQHAACIPCPRCGSHGTTRISEFGSTPCKALHRCNECLEPFEYFKCI